MSSNRARANEALRRELKRKISGTKDRASSTRPRVIEGARPLTFADDYDRRMSNWRRWKDGDSFGPGSSPLDLTRFASGIYTRTDPRRREAMMPLINGEAQDTDKAVRQLAPLLRQAVEIFYLQPGGFERKARLCGCRRETLKERLHAARLAICAELSRRRSAFQQQQERARQAQAHPAPRPARIGATSARASASLAQHNVERVQSSYSSSAGASKARAGA